ncbi:dihydrodipicolinate synthase 1 [Clostridium sp. CAG:798]|jgi:4-hydroxy-tetrahydrodipicolinate synthase|nr:dihydrodipicolinate synthase 1 [Clostridium sp. CAG:798]
MKKVLFRGCGTAIATPFTEDNINLTEFAKLVEYQINEGIDAIIVCGTTGESSTMTLEEKKTLIKFSVELIDKRVPLIVGAGSNNTATSIEMSQYAESVGADGLLLVTPYYNKTTQEGLIHHYNSIANKTTLPIILYNVPSRTGLNILPETCLELSKTENIVAIKEASGNISQIAKIAALCGNNLSIYSGNDDQNIPILSLGGIGAISVLSNVAPRFTHNMIYDFLNGNIEKARFAQLQSLELIESLFCEVNPIPVKTALNMMGYNFGKSRLPLIDMSKSGKQHLKKSLENFNLL